MESEARPHSLELRFGCCGSTVVLTTAQLHELTFGMRLATAVAFAHDRHRCPK